jgi:hypothetical protein
VKVKYVGRADAVRVAGIVADRGVAVDVPDEIAVGLLEQDWSKATSKKTAPEGVEAEEAI